MSIKKNIAEFLRRYKDARNLTIAEMSDELCIAKSIILEYLNGDGNPRADTLELMAEKCEVPVTEIISAQPPGWERAEIASQAARLFSSLPPEQRDRAVELFLSLVDVFSEGDQT